jgi:hemolysin D
LILEPVGKPVMDVFGEDVPLAVGMNVSAEIKIKEKRIIDFFLDPFRRYTSEALRER